MLNQADDLLESFQLESSHLRGRIVRLSTVLDLVLHQHNYPHAVGHLLGEAVVLAAALASSLKYEGLFTLQAKGDGVVRLLVVDVTSDGGVRAYAQFDQDAVQGATPDRSLLGNGYMAFTCTPSNGGERYQGIVGLEGETLSQATQHYFRQSEQLPTGLVAAVQQDEHGRWRGGCVLLQRMPREGGINVESATPEAEDWTRAMMIMSTIRPEELTDPLLSADALLYRLFHEEGVRVFEPKILRHQCRCSYDRVTTMLRSLPPAEIEDLAENGVVTVSCEFCNKSYVFDKKQRADLYATKESPPKV